MINIIVNEMKKHAPVTLFSVLTGFIYDTLL